MDAKPIDSEDQQQYSDKNTSIIPTLGIGASGQRNVLPTFRVYLNILDKNTCKFQDGIHF